MKMKMSILCALLAVAAWSCGGDDDGGDSTGDLGDLGDLVAIDGASGESDSAVGQGSCEPSGSCLQGPPCGDDCCGTGERCVEREFGPECACGTGPACEVGDTCASGIPSEDQCGSVCCGGGGGDPCPP